MAGEPFSKTQQLARAERRYARKIASPKQWQAIAEAKQGPCRCCLGAPPNELHHLVARSLGGWDTADNIVPLCRECHSEVEARDTTACAALRYSLTDAEYSYAVDALGETRFEQRYPVKWEKA